MTTLEMDSCVLLQGLLPHKETLFEIIRSCRCRMNQGNIEYTLSVTVLSESQRVI